MSGAAQPEPWYAEGLRFTCTACGDCCKNHGDGFQYVYSSRAERRALAAHFGISQRAFERRYCEKVEGWLSFKSREQACVFLRDGKCSVYALRPTQCRTFPFWHELVASRRAWERDVLAHCPGSRSGRRHGRAEIERRLAENAEIIE